MKGHVIDFFIWYYIVFFKIFFNKQVSNRFIYLMNLTDASSMLGNLFRPLYQDNSFAGRIFGFFIRLVWGSVGLVISVIVTIPFLIGSIILLVFPFVPLVMIYFYINKI